ncbi:flavin monoamine oxidase family protein [Solwaraspora sp. WMMD406]|uniref:flavin monoamine oxidase family protein n=1 Tax=Solwaraspora sp. WMMD406 TaxID=3016095 RepID=UPI0024161935|nr:flavin monoamine oxidase family protein [Solwaraspora sp. WMMD406]MDG4766400.1 flavin monoamine oxidase family protein [Solwaraspora sp. WMMD406]
MKILEVTVSESVPSVSRRRFLQSVGVSGGAGALFATMGALGLAPTATAAVPAFAPPRAGDLQVTGRSAGRVVVLGAGIAGLTAAYELGKAGYQCTVLEARDLAGGRSLTVRHGTSETDLDSNVQRADYQPGTYFNAGPARIAQWMVTMDYCRELGVPVEVFTNANANALIYNENSGMPPESAVRYRTAKADMYGYVAELLAKATDQGALDDALTSTDKDRLLSFLQSFGAIGGRSSGWAYGGTTRRGYLSDPGAGNDAGVPLGAPPPLSEVFASNVGRYFSFELGYDQAMLMFQPVGGMDRIVAALVRAIGPASVRTGAEVTELVDGVNGVTVTYRRGGRLRRIEADFCVAALPPHLMARVTHNLGASVQDALGRFPASPAGKIGIEYRSRWWERDLRIYGGITETDLDLAHIWYPSHDFHAERGLIVGYYNTGSAARTYGSLTPAQRHERAIDQGMKIHGERYRTEAGASFSVAWHRVRHLEGAWVSAPYGTAAYDLLLRPAGRVYFAGDWLSRTVAWQHGAFLSARSVVTAIHSRVLTG